MWYITLIIKNFKIVKMLVETPTSLSTPEILRDNPNARVLRFHNNGVGYHICRNLTPVPVTDFKDYLMDWDD